MRASFAFPLIFAAMPLAAFAQDDPPWTPPSAEPETKNELPDSGANDGLSLIERGAGILLRDMLSDVGPELDQMSRDFSDSIRQFAPMARDLATQIDDLRNYEPPKRLANGDILIQRKPGAPPPPAFNGAPDDGTDTPETLPLVDPDAPEVEL